MARRFICCFAYFVVWAGLLSGADHRGQVTCHGLPVPGAVVTATRGEAAASTTTDERGAYLLTDLAEGTWKFEVDFPGFEKVAALLHVSSAASPAHWDLKLLAPSDKEKAPPDEGTARVSEVRAMRKPSGNEARPDLRAQIGRDVNAAALGHSTGFENRSGGETLQELEAIANEALVVSGSGPAGPPRSVQGRTGLAPYRGSVGLSYENSIWNARAFSFSGDRQDKPPFAKISGSLTVGGPLRIPKLLSGANTDFTSSYSAGRARSWAAFSSTMPSALERSGDFSNSVARGQVSIQDPFTRQPFPGNRIPVSRIDPASLGLLDYIPMPNRTGVVRNYQYITTVPNSYDSVIVSVNHRQGRRDRFSGTFSRQWNRGASPQLMGFGDTTGGGAWNTKFSWVHTFAARLIGTTRLSFSYDRNQLLPYFAYRENIAAKLGISGTATDPLNWGPPNLFFTNFGELQDGNASRSATQSGAISELVLWNRNQHNLTFGLEYSRRQMNRIADMNARGSLSFTGLATSGPSADGFDFADFLLGLPETSSVRFGGGDTYFRSSDLQMFLQDDWRVASRLTLNVGLRYDYASPVREKYNRMANLAVAPGFTGATPVFPLDTLVQPDRNNVSPRIGLAWRASGRHSTVVRAGYGWYFNANIYDGIADNLAQQPPFAKASTVASSADRWLTMGDAFGGTLARQVSNTFAVNPEYRVGYAQSWKLSVEQNLGRVLVGEVIYVGIKGTGLDVLSIPNRFLPPTVAPFIYESSDGSSIYHGGSARISRRFSGALTAQLRYTFSKSIDNASNVAGSGSGYIVQDAFNYAAERGLSSFDTRHAIEGNWQLKLGKNWMLSSTFAYRSGFPLTATVLGNRADIASTGVIGTVRADATGLPIHADNNFFNLAAFDVTRAGQFGSAGRGTIPGPGMFVMNGSVSRSFSLGERRALEFRVDADNVVNHVNITRLGTIVNASNYGLATAAAAMRNLNMHVRFRF
jgi:hypothetical protein